MNHFIKFRDICYVFIVVIFCNLNFVVLGVEETQTLWGELIHEYKTRNDRAGMFAKLLNDKKIFDNFLLIEHMPLVKAEGEITPGHAALASILQFMDFTYAFNIPAPSGRFSNGEVIIETIIKNLKLTGVDVKKREKLSELYRSYVSSFDTIKIENKNLSLGQQLAARLAARSTNPEDAIRTFLEDRLYRPVIRTKISSDMAKTYLECQVPFVLIRDAKYYLCLGYAVKNNTLFFVVASPEKLTQVVLKDEDTARRASEADKTSSGNPLLDFDWQGGQTVRDIMFTPQKFDGTGIDFIEAKPQEQVIVIGRLQPDQAKVNSFILKYKNELDNILQLTNQDKASSDTNK